jgi:hypothetical protein
MHHEMIMVSSVTLRSRGAGRTHGVGGPVMALRDRVRGRGMARPGVWPRNLTGAQRRAAGPLDVVLVVLAGRGRGWPGWVR